MKRWQKALLATAMLAQIGLVVVFEHIDWYPKLRTYGISIGTNDRYCSLELTHWQPQLSCEHAS